MVKNLHHLVVYGESETPLISQSVEKFYGQLVDIFKQSADLSYTHNMVPMDIQDDKLNMYTPQFCAMKMVYDKKNTWY